jgi:hypothetical protein
MQRKVTGYLIDPLRETTDPVEIDGDDMQTWFQALKCDVTDFNRVGPQGEAVLSDYEGPLKGGDHYFAVEGYPQPIAGRGIWINVDARGLVTTPVSDLDAVRSRVHFLNLRGALAMMKDAERGRPL